MLYVVTISVELSCVCLCMQVSCAMARKGCVFVFCLSRCGHGVNVLFSYNWCGAFLCVCVCAGVMSALTFAFQTGIELYICWLLTKLLLVGDFSLFDGICPHPTSHLTGSANAGVLNFVLCARKGHCYTVYHIQHKQLKEYSCKTNWHHITAHQTNTI
jgi:hypothetical protein